MKIYSILDCHFHFLSKFKYACMYVCTYVCMNVCMYHITESFTGVNYLTQVYTDMNFLVLFSIYSNY